MTKEELIEQISAQVAARVKEVKDRGDDPVKDEGIRQMVKELIEKQNETPAPDDTDAARNKGGFQVEDEEGNDVTFKYLNRKVQIDEDGTVMPTKMLMTHDQLRDYTSSSLAEKLVEWQRVNDDLFIVGSILTDKINKKSFRKSFEDILRETDIYKRAMDRLKSDTELRKALSTGAAGSGAEWIPTGFSNQLIEKIRLERKVAALFPTINMPTNPYKLPVESAGATGYLIPESTGDDSTKIKASTPTTANFSFTASKLAGRVVFSEEINEDAIVNMMDFVQNSLATAISEATEKAILNGDNSTTHQDTNVTSAYDAQKAFDGLRYFALNSAGTATKNAGNVVLTTKLLRGTRGLMGKHGVDPSKLAYICSPIGYIEFLDLTELLTIDKYGAGATILKGEIGRYDGAPVIASEFMYENFTTTGKYDGSTTDRTGVLLVYTPAFWIGNRTGMSLGTDMDIETDQVKLVAKRRIAFEDPYDATLAANIQAAYLINVKTTI